jgi:hypothetical protein
MATKMQHSAAWALVERQHGVVTRAQLLALGYSTAAIRHRLDEGRLHVVYRGVYAVGRPQLGELGTFMAAVLSAGEGAALSDETGAVLWRVLPKRPGPIHVSTPHSRRGHPGIVLHRRRAMKTTRRHGIPVTTPVETVIDIAPGSNAASSRPPSRRRTCSGSARRRRSAPRSTRRPGVAALGCCARSSITPRS